jgi:GNAT superfamily N-acetyltransferase
MDVSQAALEEIKNLRDLYLREVNCQVILYSWPQRGWADVYILRLNGRVAGYGCVGGLRGEKKETVTEFYVLPGCRGAALPLFRELAAVSQAQGIETQTNDTLLLLMLLDCAERIESHAVLFRDALTTSLSAPRATFRKIADTDRDQLVSRKLDAQGGWLIEVEGELVAAGGILWHYNVPYGDIFMAVAEPFRRRGYGSYLVQELKRTCYEMGRVPAARCNASNEASRATLQRAGLVPCGRVLTGVLKR